MNVVELGKVPSGHVDKQVLLGGLMYGVEAEQLLLFPIVQSALQPSPSRLLLSSHYYVPTLIPSPHTDVQSPEII